MKSNNPSIIATASAPYVKQYVECEPDNLFIPSPKTYPAIIQNIPKEDRAHYDAIVCGIPGVEIKDDAYDITGEIYLDDCNSVWAKTEQDEMEFWKAKKHYLFAVAIRNGIRNGIVQLIDSPHNDGPVCKIGENWFYFAQNCSEEFKTAAEFCASVSEDAIVEAATNALIDMTFKYPDEYDYYKSVLAVSELFLDIC